MRRGVHRTLVRVSPLERLVSSARGVPRTCQRLPRRHGPVSTACQGRAYLPPVPSRRLPPALTSELHQREVVGSAVAHPGGIDPGRGRSRSSCVHPRREFGLPPQAPAEQRPAAAQCSAADRSLDSEVACQLDAAPRLPDRRNRNSASAVVAPPGADTTGCGGALVRRSEHRQPPRSALGWQLPVRELPGGLLWLDSCAPYAGSPWVRRAMCRTGP